MLAQSAITGSLVAPTEALTILVGLLVCYGLALCVYRLSPFHPYAKYPGPFLAKLTPLRSFYYAAAGTIHLDIHAQHQKYGNVIRYAPNRVIVNTSSGLKDIYGSGKNFRKAASYSSFIMREGSHSTHSVIDKKEHGRKRRLIAQGLGESALRTSEPTITTTIDTFLDRLTSSDYPGGEMYKGVASTKDWGPAKNMADTCNFLTFDVFSDLLLGKSFGMLQSSLNRYIVRGVASSSRRAGIFLQMPSLTKIYADMVLFPRTAVWRNRFFQTVVDISTERLGIKEGRRDIFQLIQDAKDPDTGESLPMDELVSECTLLIVAGSDTSSTTLAATFFYLAKTDRAYQRLAREVRSAFQSKHEIKAGQALNSCVYLRACIDEALRMSPPVGGSLWREAQAGGAVVDGVYVPPHYDAGVGHYALHHNEDYYPQPFEYRPERWIAEGDTSQEMVNAAKSAFCPFSSGPRGCPGKSLAYLEISITIARAIWLFDFAFQNPADANQQEFKLVDHFTAAKDGPQLKFKKRTDVTV